jgi:hypothetical protein
MDAATASTTAAITRNYMALSRPRAARTLPGRVGPGRGAGISTGPFPWPALRTRRAHYWAPGAPQASLSFAVFLMLCSPTVRGSALPGSGSVQCAPPPG